MNENISIERQKQVEFTVGMAAIDGGKPSAFTQNLLNQYDQSGFIQLIETSNC
ncbi:hypothetical protein [Sporosarcina sp. E16_8]|uniref:hypothetical protein n=1 Tax=Sporosarcina sp. E16_8 TaxID=2789295 RepID=UPI001A917EB6|nr:hypothetical protein [Sporosarcina sp. E16_8]MBO0589257.1 hypothetical protein [Sporosarcina sp. E16_8]